MGQMTPCGMLLFQVRHPRSLLSIVQGLECLQTGCDVLDERSHPLGGRDFIFDNPYGMGVRLDGRLPMGAQIQRVSYPLDEEVYNICFSLGCSVHIPTDFAMHRSLSAIAAFFSLAFVASAMMIPCEGAQAPETMARVFIGYNGFSADPRPPQASAGGELGAVFYITDASPTI